MNKQEYVTTFLTGEKKVTLLIEMPGGFLYVRDLNPFYPDNWLTDWVCKYLSILAIECH